MLSVSGGDGKVLAKARCRDIEIAITPCHNAANGEDTEWVGDVEVVVCALQAAWRDEGR